jgi:NTE family protein
MKQRSIKSELGMILGGGGVVGIAWEIGVLHGIAAAGVRLTSADEVIGTSAGAFAGAALLDPRGIDWAFRRQLACEVKEISAQFTPEGIATLTSIVRDYGHDPHEAGQRLGTFALKATTVSTDARMAVVRDRLASTEWPSDRLRFTAIDADDGTLHLLDKASGIGIVDAAAATGAVPGIWPVVEAGGRRWIDGGSVSATNAHLAEAYHKCLVISPMAMNLSGGSVQGQLDQLVETHSLLIVPDTASAEAIGPNPLDADRRPGAAEAGYRQGMNSADAVAAFWS